MKPIHWLVAAVLCVLVGFVAAQTVLPMPPPVDPPQAFPVTPPPPAPPVTPETPATIVIESKVDLKSQPGPQVDPHAAHEEAVNALAWAKSEGCRSDPAPRDCVRRAQDEYNAAMARLGVRR